MSDTDQDALRHQQDASEHEVFDELPETTTEAIEAAIEPPDNRFIPLRAVEVLRALVGPGAPLEDHKDALTSVFGCLREVIDQEARSFERYLLDRYHPFWPDADTASGPSETPPDEAAFLRALAYLLDKCNCERLSDPQLQNAIDTANMHGLRVEIDNSVVRHLEVFVRGRGTITKRFRSARSPIKGRPREIEVFKRLALIVSFHNDEDVILKLFRDIPLADLEALMPHARLRMNWFDRVKVFGGGAGALGGAAPKLWAVLVGSAALTGGFVWVIVGALFGLSFKSFLGYRNTMKHRVGQRTQHLYYQNLANNAGVITTLLHQVSEEELKEALLAYAFLLNGENRSAVELDDRIERWLLDRLGIDVNFDCPDGLETLDRMGLWRDRETLGVLDPDASCTVLEEHWRHRRSEGYHQSRISSAS